MHSDREMMNCRGCGVALAPSEHEVNEAVDQIFETSIEDARQTGGVCPLCGHSKYVPVSNRRWVLFMLLMATLLLLVGISASMYLARRTLRLEVARTALDRVERSPDAVKLLGTPITIESVQGEVKQDETGWSEAKLTFPVHGPNGKGVVRVAGEKGSGPWVFNVLEVVLEHQHKKIDVIYGRIVEYDPAAYVEVHTEAATDPEYVHLSMAAPTLSGKHPCLVIASPIHGKISPQLTDCPTPIPLTGSAVDRFEVDLRYGKFILRQTDLLLHDAMDVPLTRTYDSQDWIHPNPMHAFGINSNHPFDVAPLGHRNPYTYQLLALEDGDFLFFDRISKGGGYANSVFQHTETATAFYGATQRWNGRGWTMQMTDGTKLLFPESYSAKNMAQGAASEMIDRNGNKLQLVRTPKRDLQEIRAPRGGAIYFTYDDGSRITKAEDNKGHWAKYAYDDRGLLTDVVLNTGIERHYAYDGVRMTSVTDQNGHVLVQNKYHNGWLVEQDSDAGRYKFEYDSEPPYTYARRAIVIFPNGSQSAIQTADSVPDYVKNPRHGK
jgi:YD repeat-containing protein